MPVRLTALCVHIGGPLHGVPSQQQQLQNGDVAFVMGNSKLPFWTIARYATLTAEIQIARYATLTAEVQISLYIVDT